MSQPSWTIEYEGPTFETFLFSLPEMANSFERGRSQLRDLHSEVKPRFTSRRTPIRRTMGAMTAMKDERLAVRMTARQRQIIERAAAVTGRNITEFSVQALTERAEEVLTDQRLFGVSQDAWDEFVACLDEPARPVAELVGLMRRPSVFDE